MAEPLPKLKPVGKVTAKASNGVPTARASDFIVDVRTVNLRRIGMTECVCVYRHTQNPAWDGLHFLRDGARALRSSILDAVAAAGPSVDIDNHRFKLPSLWERFSDADAVVLADGLARAAAS